MENLILTLLKLVLTAGVFLSTGYLLGKFFHRAQEGLECRRCLLVKSIFLILIVGLWTSLSFLPMLQGSMLAAGMCLLLGFAGACYHMRSSSGSVVKTKVVGITGTIASGKSLVGRLLEEQGIPVLDTDHIAHDVQADDEAVRAALRRRFGNDVFKDNGDLDRKKLGDIVFNDKAALQDLNKIVHPAVIRECRRLIAEHKEAPLVAVLVPLLFEAGLEKEYDEIWTVVAREEVVRERLKAREGISDEEAEKRIKSQFPQSEKVARSHRVIDNSGTVDDTRRQVELLLQAS